MSTAYITSRQSGGQEDWRNKLKQQIDDELNRRVRDALETPPLERLRRRQLQNRAKAAAAVAAEAESLNAHLDLTEKEREYILSRKRQFRAKTQLKIETEPNTNKDTETCNRFFTDGSSNDGLPPAGRVYTGNGYISIPQQRPAHVQSGGFSYEDWAFFDGHGRRPTYPDGVAPIIPHPKLKNLIHPEIEPLYTSIPVVPGAITYDSQITPYTHKWRGICIVYDSEKSSRIQTNVEQPSNPLYAPNLIFESRFESGNLRQARRVGQFEYELVLKTDVFTKRHTQWYYFRIQNMLPGIIYKFRIVNLLKRDSLYNHGMRPLMYSERNAEENNIGWIRQGHHISYGRNVQHTQCPLLSREIPYYELEWQMSFPYEQDTCYMAHCYPYTYTDLKNDLDTILSSAKTSQYVKKDVMCETKAGNSCYVLTVTDFNIRNNKQYVVVSARVHPGESNSSWMLKGLLDHITDNTVEADEMRKAFVFKIIPMLNPDGVIVGNYRCSLQARDLNRNYRHPTRENFPTVWNLKKLVEHLNNTVGVFVYCDFHGHSRKADVFMYGNNPSAEQNGNTKAYLDERMLPFCISKVGNGMFSFDSCKFQIRKCKESTGRVVMYRHFNIKNSFTMEATFSGTLLDRNGSRHFNQRDFMNAGKFFAQGVLEYSKMDADENKQTEIILDLTRTVTKQIIATSKLNAALRQTIEAMMSKTFDEEINSELEAISEGYNQSDSTETDADINTNKTDRTTTQDSSEQLKTSKRDTVLRVLNAITEETISKCVALLDQLSLPIEPNESESSDSDSESEPELVEDKSKKKKKSKSKKKKDKKQVKSSSSYNTDHSNQDKKNVTSATDKLLHKQRTSLGIQDTSQSNHSTQSAHLPLIANPHDGDGKNGSRYKSHWTNPYEGRSNGGIPCFSEERSMERAAKRMAELQKKMEDKTCSKQSFGPFSEREYTELHSDLFYDDLAMQKRLVEANLQRSMRLLHPNNHPHDKIHMDFLKGDNDNQDFKNNYTPNTNQFEMMTKRSHTDLSSTHRTNKWYTHSTVDRVAADTWNEAEVRSNIYKNSGDSNHRNPPNDGNNSSAFHLPPSTCNMYHSDLVSEKTSSNNKIAFLTRDYTEMLASRLRAHQIQNRTSSKTQVARSNLLKALQVNPLHSQPGLE